MTDHVVLLSVPGLRDKDLAAMPNLRGLVAAGDRAALVPSFPCVTCSVQVNMTTGKPPAEHGVVANGFYWRDKRQVEMWTAGNDVIRGPQIWDVLRQHDAELRCAVWFPLLSKGAGADWICTPAPIHNPDGSESLWCYTRPTELYGELRDTLGHFPLQHFWGPLANIKSTAWIVDSAIHLARRERPNFFYIYLPHLDYAAQRTGPDSPEARQSLADLDDALGRLIAGFAEAYGGLSSRKDEPLWLIASEYAIGAVDHVVYPNRVLREAGMLVVREEEGCEQLDFADSRAWAMVDHQFAHVYVNGGADEIARVRELFVDREGIDEVLAGDDLARYELNHERTGEVVLVSAPNSWQAYYWWLEDARAPRFARAVDIHRKPGYDPVELHFDFATKSIPLDATRVKGSHGAPAREKWQHGVMLTSQPGVLEGPPMADSDVFDLVLRQFGI
ncbi:MAG TPA: nucleotide pyrophosphatase/phosphodiesterase family protein [Pirellulales bacterium]|jgi:predicted AlkP superfamily pyrophosphatase or phosphodiesterase|nr:nucleotide pyrophosphatase/phosphodiesterase family protein [Pirellulales bacterium]